MEQLKHPICDAGSRVAKNIKIRARRLARSGAIPGMEAEDIEQHLRLHLLKRDDRFDPARGQYDTFADRVLVNCITSLAKPTGRIRAERAWLSFEMPVPTSEDEEILFLGDTFSEEDRLFAAPSRPWDEAINLALDVRSMLSTLPGACRDVAALLTYLSPTEAAHELGIHRSTVYAHMAVIRSAAADLGLEAYLSGARHIRPSAGM